MVTVLRKGNRAEHSDPSRRHDIPIQHRPDCCRLSRPERQDRIWFGRRHVHIVADVPEQAECHGAQRIVIARHESSDHQLVTENRPPPMAALVAKLPDILERNGLSHIRRHASRKLRLGGQPGEVRIRLVAADKALSFPCSSLTAGSPMKQSLDAKLSWKLPMSVRRAWVHRSAAAETTFFCPVVSTERYRMSIVRCGGTSGGGGGGATDESAPPQPSNAKPTTPKHPRTALFVETARSMMLISGCHTPNCYPESQ